MAKIRIANIRKPSHQKHPTNQIRKVKFFQLRADIDFIRDAIYLFENASRTQDLLKKYSSILLLRNDKCVSSHKYNKVKIYK